MTDDDADGDAYYKYAEQYDPDWSARPARGGRKQQAKAAPKRSQRQIVAELAEPTGLEAGFVTSYQPARYEAVWLLDSLRMFYDEQLITDVLGQVKGGKEASVYRCAAHPTTGETLLAAKVYRPRMFRNLRNDKMYREGRSILSSDGSAVKKTDHRLMRAVGKKTAFGVQVAHTSWLMYEYTTMERLFQAGASVPRPYAAGENAILMTYFGDERRAAPTLSEIRLPTEEAEVLFQEVLRNIELLLEHGLIHGDLSAYNILYWQEKAVLIDFPQVSDITSNSKSDFILRRDITRVCEYFIRQGVRCDPAAITRDLWERYGALAEQQAALLAAEQAALMLETDFDE
ncbi:MAG: RIO1 family regulatory kinase/ATPase [Roseiflexaceae bacterium]